MLIKDLHVTERPREKLQRYGSAKLTDIEVIALLLNTGSGKKGVLELAAALLKNRPLAEFGSLKFADLTSLYGINESKACSIISAVELGRRVFQDKEPFVVTSPKVLYDRLKDYTASKKEHLLGLYLNVKNALICTEIISIGTVNESLIHPREIFEPAVRYIASGFLLAHNHPSNDPNPSREDIDCTLKINELSEMMGIKLHDHVILAKSGFYSFKEHGLL
jgi:DNA repair protein RadC